MTGTYTTAELLPRIAQTVSECLGGAHVRVWLVAGQLLEQQATWPAASTSGPVVMTAPDDLSGCSVTGWCRCGTATSCSGRSP